MTGKEEKEDPAVKIGIVIVLIFAVAILSFILYGELGLKIVLILLVVNLFGTIIWLAFDYGNKQTAKHMALGATLVTRHDYVDAYGDANIAKAQHGGGNQMLPPPESQEFRLLSQVDHSDTGEFEIDPFKLPTQVGKK